jgi:hypothetical protein
MSEIDLKELQSAYDQVTFGHDQPSELFTTLQGLRRMSALLGDVRPDIRTFLELSKDMPDDVPVVVTLTGIGIVK